MKQEFTIKDVKVAFVIMSITEDGSKITEEYIHPEMKLINLSEDENGISTLVLKTRLESAILNKFNSFKEIKLYIYENDYRDKDSIKKCRILKNMSRIRKETRLNSNGFYDIYYTYKTYRLSTKIKGIDLNAPIYANSEMIESGGTWEYTGVKDKELYILNGNMFSTCLGTKEDDINSAIGWIDNKYII